MARQICTRNREMRELTSKTMLKRMTDRRHESKIKYVEKENEGSGILPDVYDFFSSLWREGLYRPLEHA